MAKYIDTNAVIQVLGCIYNDLSIFDQTETYKLSKADFSEEFHQKIFGALYAIYSAGAKEANIIALNDYFATHPKAEAIYKVNKGDEWITRASENSAATTFNYYYNRLKKMTLLRAYNDIGVDVTDIFDPDNILDLKKRQEQEEFLDNSSLEALADIVDTKIDLIRSVYVDDTYTQSFRIGDDLEDTIESFKDNPEYGLSLYGKYINTVTRGARLGKFYLRSAASGVGKTRAMAADACCMACDELYSIEHSCWHSLGASSSTVFISTELDLGEVQTMMVAFISGVNEEHILNGRYEPTEEERVKHAIEVLKRAPLFIEIMLDFSLQDIENVIKRNVREHNVFYIFFDYIHTSLKILEEIASKTRGMKLREDNILFMISNKMKNICIEHDVFMMSGTQLSGDYRSSETPDQQLLRGAKALADKIDVGEIILSVEQKDLDSLSNLIMQNGFDIPDLKISIYKNRRGRYKSVYLWCKADLGICRIDPMFMTTWDYKYIELENTNLN